MRTLNIGIIGDGDVERSVSDYYRKERLAMCNLNPREAELDWKHFFTANDGMILDYRSESEPDQRLDTAILTATRAWQSQVVVITEDYENCWSWLKAISVEPLMVIPRPPDGSTEYHGYRVDLYRAAKEIARASLPPTTDPDEEMETEVNTKRSVAPLLQLTGALLVVGGLVVLVGLLILNDGDWVKIGGVPITLVGTLISTGVTMLGGPKIHGLASSKANP